MQIGASELGHSIEAAGLPQELRVTTHIADVADRTQVERFRDEVADHHQTDKIHLLFITYDGEHFRAGAAHHVPAALVEWSERNPVQFRPGF